MEDLTQNLMQNPGDMPEQSEPALDAHTDPIPCTAGSDTWRQKSKCEAQNKPGAAMTIDFDDPKTAYAHRSTAQLRVATWVFRSLGWPVFSKVAASVAAVGLQWRIPAISQSIAWTIQQTVFSLFVGGRSLAEAQKTVHALQDRKVSTIYDYAVEGEKTEAGFDAAMGYILQSIEAGKTNGKQAFCAIKLTALLPFALLAKRQANSGALLDKADKAIWDRGVARLEKLCQAAAKAGVPLLIDAEESWIQASIDVLAVQAMARFNKERAIIYTTIQLYLKNGESVLHRFAEQAKRNNWILGVKLVRGAYMVKEAARAQSRGLPNPIHPSKQATDTAFDNSVRYAIDHIDRVWICAATHNVESVRQLVALMEERNIAPSDPRIVIAQLLGMLDRITFPLSAEGYNTAKYVPFGAVADVFPYLTRRADENPSVAAQSSGDLAMILQELQRRQEAKGQA